MTSVLPSTIPQLFFWRADQLPDAEALQVKRDGRFQPVRWSELETDVLKAIAALSRWVKPGERVVHVSENRYEWLIADLAIQSLGAIHVPLHATLTVAQQAAQAANAEPCCLIRSTETGLSLPGIPTISYAGSTQPNEYSWRSIVNEAFAALGLQAMESAARHVHEQSIATILYTSGTSGESKGVVLTQRNVTSNAIASFKAFMIEPAKKRFNFLPFSHIFARTCDIYAWLVGGYQLILAESKDTVVPDCQATGPHIITAVPYFYDRVHRNLKAANVSDTPGVLKKTLGGKLEFCCSGGAPLSGETYDYYLSQGILICQGYGLTETSPVIATNTPRTNRRGSVGPLLSGLQVRIAEDGEICTKGDHVMQGYWQMPQATQDVLKDGWFSTGDIGRLDEDGFLWVTGRKKELIVTATGKKIAPVLVESLLDQNPLIAQSFVFGDRQKYLVALLVPNMAQLQPQLERLGLQGEESWKCPLHPDLHQLFEAAIRQQLVRLSHCEQVQRFCLLDQPFSVESGELTAKLSLRRPVIVERYAAQIQALYDQP
jgi:long-chain acyl-CoA synthetase